jgi:hypothetical protein
VFRALRERGRLPHRGWVERRQTGGGRSAIASAAVPGAVEIERKDSKRTLALECANVVGGVFPHVEAKAPGTMEGHTLLRGAVPVQKAESRLSPRQRLGRGNVHPMRLKCHRIGMSLAAASNPPGGTFLTHPWSHFPC